MDRSRKDLIAALGAGAAGAALFVGWHSFDEYRALAPFYRHTALTAPIHQTSLSREVLGSALVTLAIYVGFAVSSAAIAAKTRDRILWIVPGTMFVFSTLPGMLLFQDRAALRPIVDRYAGPGSGTGGWNWLFALADLALILVPGAVVALGVARRGEAATRADDSARLAFVVCGALAFVFYLRARYVSTGSFDVNVSAHLMLGVLFVVGASLGVRRPWFPVVHLGVALCLSDAIWVVSSIGTSFAVGSTIHMVRLAASTAAPSLAAVGFGALSDPLARYLRARGSRARAVPVTA